MDSFAAQKKVAKDKYTDRDYTINGIDNLTSLGALQNKQLSISDFKNKELAKIVAATTTGSGEVAESAPYYVTRAATVITTTEELETYLEKLRRDMTKLIIENKTIILK